MSMKSAIATGLVAAGMMLGGAAHALPPLNTVKPIDEGLFAVALAVEISDACASISPRTIRGLSVLRSLKTQANQMGYSDTEIEAHVKSKAEKARMRARGEAYVRAQGLDPKNPADLCTLGQQEIARGSQVGALLRMK